MRRVFLLVVMVLMSISYAGFSASAEVKREGKTFVQSKKNSDTKTEFTYKDSIGEYPIFISKSGACYILKISKKSGNVYKKYLNKEIAMEICKELGVEYKNKK